MIRGILLLALGLFVGFIAARTHSRPTAGSFPESQFDRKALKLDAPVTLRASNIKLSDLLDELVRQTNCRLQVDWSSLAPENANAASLQITVDFRNLTLEQALHQIYQLPAVQPLEINHYVDEGHLLITHAPASKFSVTRIYDIEPLIDVMMERRPPPKLAEIETCFAGKWWRFVNTRDEAGEEIVSLVRDTIDTNSWKENGGSLGALRSMNDVLIITQTQENHDAIARLLNQPMPVLTKRRD